MLTIAFSDCYNFPLPEGHRFPMLKYDLIPEQLMYEGIISRNNLFVPDIIDEKWIVLTHSSEYWNKLKNGALSLEEMRRIDFAYSQDLIHREVVIVSGTIQSAYYALKHGVSFNVAGGTHHAYVDKGEGFCFLNDNAIAANYLIANSLAKRILIVDLDVHQGNGTASIFQYRSNVFTFSMHCISNIYSTKEYSDLDIELLANTSDDEYLAFLTKHLNTIFHQFKPDFVFYQAGVDVLITDKLGKLSMTKEGCQERDYIIFKKCKEYKVPVAVNMGGGYSERIADIVDAHCNTFKAANSVFSSFGS
jgi:acetoin utilization deacetylase AcuC-like enzyme